MRWNSDEGISILHVQGRASLHKWGLGGRREPPPLNCIQLGLTLSDRCLKPAPPLDRLLEERQPYVLEESTQKWSVCLAELGDGKEGMFLVQIMQTLEFGLTYL